MHENAGRPSPATLGKPSGSVGILESTRLVTLSPRGPTVAPRLSDRVCGRSRLLVGRARIWHRQRHGDRTAAAWRLRCRCRAVARDRRESPVEWTPQRPATGDHRSSAHGSCRRRERKSGRDGYDQDDVVVYSRTIATGVLIEAERSSWAARRERALVITASRTIALLEFRLSDAPLLLRVPTLSCDPTRSPPR